jgi:hypothetical protein
VHFKITPNFETRYTCRPQFYSVFRSDVVQAFRPAGTADLKVRTTPNRKTLSSKAELHMFHNLAARLCSISIISGP